DTSASPIFRMFGTSSGNRGPLLLHRPSWGPGTTPTRCILEPKGLSRATAADGAVQGDVAEGAAGIAAQCGDGGDADDDDQGQHDGVFDRRRAILIPEELLHPGEPRSHANSPFLHPGS